MKSCRRLELTLRAALCATSKSGRRGPLWVITAVLLATTAISMSALPQKRPFMAYLGESRGDGSPNLTTFKAHSRRAVGHERVSCRVVNVIFRVLLNIVWVLLRPWQDRDRADGLRTGVANNKRPLVLPDFATRAAPPNNGSPNARPSCCRCPTFTSCAACRRRSSPSPTRTRP
jgi:hypothetical protein